MKKKNNKPKSERVTQQKFSIMKFSWKIFFDNTKEREEYKNDVRYQEWTEMILDCEGSTVKDHFYF